ncbi:ribonuclease H family protein, partial [Mycobacterium kansasii]
KGEFKFAFSKGYSLGSSFLAEVKAVVNGLIICIDKGFNLIEVESDSLVVVDMLTRPGDAPWSVFY